MKIFQSLLLLILLFSNGVSLAQFITVDDSFSETSLVTTKLINSPCANVDNFTSKGGTFVGSANKSFGYFEKGTSNFPFQNGILLTSSRAIRSVGPNNSELSEGTVSWSGDADLQTAIGRSNTYNATVIEFDFVPFNSNFSFNYIFASEEYAENYPCLYSDGFAFLLKPVLGNQPYQNLAVIPNTTIPVSSTSIRPQITVALPEISCGANNPLFFAGYNTSGSAINYNGQTVVMTAKADVTPGVKYHIKLVIADQTDEKFDSAIFIEGGSFNISANLGPSRTVLGGNPVCGNQNIVLNATIPGINTYKWYKNGLLIPTATQPIFTATETGTYKVEITVTGSTCVAESQVELQFAPAFSLTPKTIKQCDTDLDLITNVNLRQIEPEIVSNFADCTFKYYQNETAANAQNGSFLIANPNLYNNQNGNEVWVRVQNSYGCVVVIKISLTISATQLPLNYSQTLSKCDDFVDIANNDRDGVSLFDFTSVSANLSAIIPNPNNYQIKYYKTEADFNAETDAQGKNLSIQNIQNYRNIGFLNNQTIWIKVQSNLDSSCFGFGKLFLIVEKKPIAYPVSDIRGCDDNPNDAILEHSFNTSNIQNIVLGNQIPTDYVVTYFDESNQVLSSPLPNPFLSKTQKIRIRVTNKNGADVSGTCWNETFMQLIVDQQPIANAIIVPTACSIVHTNGTNVFGFDTATFTSSILGTQTGFIVKYFDNNNQLLNPIPNPYLSPTETIKAVVENPLNTACTASIFINLKVNPSPEVTSSTENFICSGATNSITISSGLNTANIADFSFKWFRNNIEIAGEANETLAANNEGTYVCQVTNIQSGCSTSSTTKVVFSEKATITSLIISDLIENNTLKVTVSGNGSYQFSIDEPMGPFQQSGFFSNIAPGFHTLYVNDKKGCETTSKLFAIVGAMPYFTPNGDSFNDFWQIRGVNATSNSKSKVQIFDRFGRLLSEIPSGASIGWDGTFNGEPLPADDYWFTLTLEDGRTTSGHFSLKR